MRIDISSVNLLEKDIEEWIYRNPQTSRVGFPWEIKGWVGRQYALPSGIADLIAITDSGTAMVIEVKNVPIKKSALTQVCRYAYDVQCIVAEFAGYPTYGSAFCQVEKYVVGTSIDQQTLTEAVAMNVGVQVFESEHPLIFTNVYLARDLSYQRATSRLADRKEWNVFGRRIGE